MAETAGAGPETEAAGGATRDEILAALPRLRRFCQAMSGSAEDGDELMQATVERALSRSHLFEAGTRVDSWMFRIAQNLHIDAKRRDKRRGTQVSEDELAAVPGEDGRVLTENRSDLAFANRALQALPEDQRVTFALVVLEGLSYREASEALSVPIGTVMSRLGRARSKIAEELAKGGRIR